MMTPIHINSRDCGWCGAVAMRGPYKHPDYETTWFLCPYCSENVEGMEPAITTDTIESYIGEPEVVIKVDGETVARFPEGYNND